jgi:excisionase family DNA binding protein
MEFKRKHKTINDMIVDGYKVTDLAKMLGVTRHAVYMMIEKDKDIRFLKDGDRWSIYEVKKRA